MRDAGHRMRARLTGAAHVAAAIIVASLLIASGRPAEAGNAANAAPYAASVAAWSNAVGVDPQEVGALAVPLDGQAPLIEYQARVPFNPASTVKVLTTWAALSVLGPDFRWQTSFYLRGPLEDGVLRGDLVVRGGGDPKLVIEHLQEIVAGLRAAGLERIEGDLVLDDSIFEVPLADAAEFDGQPWQPYNVLPSGVLLNFKSARLIAQPAGERVAFAFDPPLDGVAIDNLVRVVSGPCRYGVDALHVRDMQGEPMRGGPALRVSGAYSRSCGSQSRYVSVLDHRAFAGALFGAAWKAAGGQWSGSARIGRGAARGTPWFVWTSPHTLADVVHDINKRSNNVMTRQLLLQLAVHAGERPATLAHARALLRDWLRARGLESSAIVLDNGSGLSRTARVSAADLVAALRAAARGGQAALLRESLPLVGIDGTMKMRFAGEPLVGRAWIKTGSLHQVRAIAGYVQAAGGRMYAVAMLVNGEGASSSRPLQDAFLRWVHDNG